MDKKVIHKVFEENVKKNPSKIAVEAASGSITYSALNELANRIAHLLEVIGCKPGTIVNVVGPSSIQLVAAMLSAFKKGAIFLPVDLEFSEKRLRQIFRDTFHGILVVKEEQYEATTRMADKLAVAIDNLIIVDDQYNLKVQRYRNGLVTPVPFEALPEWNENFASNVQGGDSSYIVYTSASTGEGKAIEGMHAGLSHFIHWEIKEFNLGEDVRVSQLAQVTFDAFLRDVFTALTAGGTLYIPHADVKSSPLRLLDWLNRSAINLMHCVPSLFRVIIKELQANEIQHYRLDHLQYIIMAGELLYGKDIHSWRKLMGDRIKLVNLYGTSETTLAKTFFRIENMSDNPSQIIPAGKPISNTTIAVIKDARICKVGEIGEVYIKTPFMTKGYYNNPVLTQECFVQNPLSDREEDIVYKTGDLGRYLPDGNIEVVGRLDSQVKVNGIRVELTEVEQAMIRQEKITGTVISVYKRDDNLASLIAYYTGEKADPDQLREALSKELNKDVIPSWFMHMDEFPLNINGKVDKKALPLPEDILVNDANFESPSGSVEQALAEIWKEILGLRQVGRNSPFFTIGGNSLKAIQLIARIDKVFGANLKIAHIFTHRTIRELAEVIAGSMKRAHQQISPAAQREYYPLSSSQHRIWVLSQLEDSNVTFNIPAIFVLEGNLYLDAVTYSFETLVARHESLRTTFREDEQGIIRQFITSAANTSVKITCQDLRKEVHREVILKEMVQAVIAQPFNLATGPLIRASLFQLTDHTWVFAYVMHHICSDGWSMNILIRELHLLYNAHVSGTSAALVPLNIQYKDYAVWQQERLKSEALKAHKAYWLEHLRGDLPVLNLKGDKPRPLVKTHVGGVVYKHIDARLTRRLKGVSQVNGGTLFMGLLATVNVLLYRYSGQDDMVVGTPVAGRDHVDLENQIGFYVNTLALRTKFSGSDSFHKLLDTVKQLTLRAFEYQAYPLDELMGELNYRRDSSRSALFDVMVLLQNMDLTHNTWAGLTMKDIQVKEFDSAEHVVSKYDLTFYFTEVDGGIATRIEYNSDIFNRETIASMGDYLETLLTVLTADPARSIDELVNVSLQRSCVPLKQGSTDNAIMACTEHQSRLWYIDQFEKGYLYEKGPVYHNLPLVMNITGNIDASRLRNSLNAMMEEVPMLRTRITISEGVPFQYIEREAKADLQVHSRELQEQSMVTRCLAIINKPFDVEEDLLIRFDLVKYDEAKCLFIITAHHVIADRRSLTILFEDIMRRYNGESIAKNDVQYFDFAAWQNTLVQHAGSWPAFHWQRKLKDMLVLNLDTDRQREHIHIYEADLITHQLSQTLLMKVDTFCREHQSQPFMFLLTCFNVLLHRYTNHDEIVIGTLYDNRRHKEFERVIGPLANLLTLRNKVQGSMGFLQLLKQVSDDYESAVRFADYPFECVVRDVNPEKDMSRTALFDILIHYEEDQPPRDKPIAAEAMEFNYGCGKYDLNLLIKKGHDLVFYLTFNKKYFNRSSIDRFMRYFTTVIERVLEIPVQPVEDLSLLDAPEKSRLIALANHVDVKFDSETTVVQLFDEQVAKTPDHTAIVWEGNTLSYRDLDGKATLLGLYLRDRYDIQRDDLVGVKLDRSDRMVIALLGVLKAGGAYVPIDPAYPDNRITYIVSDSRCKVVIDEDELQKFTAAAHQYEGKTLPVINKPGDLAYVIYTSGTTGNPKGVLIEHKNIVRLFKTEQPLFDFSATDVWTMFHSFCFDFSVWEMYGALLFGGRLVIVPSATAKDPDAFVDLLAREKVTVLNQTPSSFYNLAKAEQARAQARLSVRYVIFGGEALSPVRLAGWQERYPWARLINMYGITETTVHVTYRELTAEDVRTNSRNIGRPIPTLSCYVLDRKKQLLPVGVFGELYVGGEGVARGYLNRKELTDQRFIISPFNEGERLYRSGDFVRLLENGEMEYAGRMDNQVKVRGYRIELEEIESVLCRHKAIEEAVVVAREDEKGEKTLIAYIVSNERLDVATLRPALVLELPAYMVPARFVQLSALPLTNNGKVDKKALPDPEGVEVDTGTAYQAPRNEIEQHLAEIYAEVLNKQRISINDDFFALGGDSIKSIQIVSRLKQRGYTLTIRDIMMYPVLSNLAAQVKQGDQKEAERSEEGYAPLSPVQRAFFEQQSVDRHHYNQSVFLVSKLPLSEAGITASLDYLVAHHGALQTVFEETPEGWMQIQRTSKGYSLDTITYVEEAQLAAHCDHIQAGIDLTHGPLFKAALFRGPGKDRLLLVAHHLIVDSVSWRILLEDLGVLYQQYLTNQPLRLSLKTDSFTYWQQQQMAYAKTASLLQEDVYWSAIASHSVKPLPLDNPGGSNLVGDSASKYFVLSKDLTEKLLTRCYKAYRTEINDILITALGMAVQRTFGLDKVAINLEGHGREYLNAHTDVTHTVGWFTTMYPVVLNMSNGDDSISHLIAIKEILHRVPNKGIGYGMLRYLAGKSYAIQPEITFNYLGDFDAGRKSAQDQQLFELTADYRGREISPRIQRNAVLNITGIVVEGKISLSIGYSAGQYNAVTIERLAESYERYLSALIHQLSAEENAYLTPVDVTYKALSLEQLQRLSEKDEIEDVYPLSPLQQGLYYHWLQDEDSGTYFEQMCYKVQGDLDIAVLEQSFRLIVSRHAILRTHFTADMGETLLQVVKKEAGDEFNYLDISGNGFSIPQFKAQDRSRGFDLNGGYPMRLTVLGMGNNIYEFIWSFHHIIMDGWCIGILIKEFFQVYYALSGNRTPELGRVYPYSKYIEWLSHVNEGRSLAYWKNYLDGYDTIASVPHWPAKTKQGARSMHGLTTSLGGALRNTIRHLCRDLGITENVFIQTAWGILLGRYNNTHDVVFGAVVSGRPAALPGIEDMVGLFINTIPVRVQARSNMSVAGLLKEMQQAAIDGLEHHYVQLSSIQSESALGRNLFDHIVVFENYPLQSVVEQGISTTEESEKLALLSCEVTEQTNYDFSMMVNPSDVLAITFNYNANVHPKEQMARLQQHLVRVISQVAGDPHMTLSEVDLLDKNEAQQLLVDFNLTTVQSPQEKTLVGLFESQEKRMSQHPAVVFEGSTLTYRQLNEKANQLARYLLKKHNVGSNALVGIKLRRSERLIVAMLGVLKSGSAYLPIDPDDPKARIDDIMKRSGLTVVLDEQEWNTFTSQMTSYETANVPQVYQSDQLAYVIYTSGSTGQPKGVMISHSAIVNTIHAQQHIFGVKSGEKHLQFAPATFDASVSEIFVALASGSTLYIVDEDTRMDPLLMEEYIATHKISMATIPPAYLKLLRIEKIQTLEKLITAGEPANDDAIRFSRYGTCFNAYGPTEAAICATVFTVNKDTETESSTVPIGRPIPNALVYIVDDHMRLTPMGVAGEICIGGAGLAQGYMGMPQLTDEKFVANPFKSGEKVYRTGDLGRWLPDGNIEFIGRKDNQVKIRGYRIEPGEIESVLTSHEAIKEAVVLATTNKSDEKELTAFIVASESLNTLNIRSYLQARLPAYMIPSNFVSLDSLPLTQSGKIDRKSLAAAGREMDTGKEYTGPANDTEEKLAMIWQDLLDRKKIGVDENFFEAGGNSIKIIRLSKLVSAAFEKNISVPVLFRYTSIRTLAAYILHEQLGHEVAEVDREELVGELDKFNIRVK